MHVPVLLAVVAITIGGTAAAQPAPAPAACSVRIVRAPEAVQTVVEGWVRAEPRCRVALEVRIIATYGGLYVLARDDRGRIYERIVPDATSAAVLITSWAADDALASPAQLEQLLAPPRWLSVGGFSELATMGARVSSESFGGRVDLDLRTSEWWVLGAAGAVGRTERVGYPGDFTGAYLQSYDVAVFAFARLSGRLGNWEVAPTVAAGLMYSYSNMSTMTAGFSSSAVWPIGQASVIVSYRFGRVAAIIAGPISTVYSQRLGEPGSALRDVSRSIDVAMLGGVRWGL